MDQPAEVTGSPSPDQPVGRVNRSTEPDTRGGAPAAQEQTFKKVALGALMLGLTILGLYLILSGVFVVVPEIADARR